MVERSAPSRVSLDTLRSRASRFVAVRTETKHNAHQSRTLPPEELQPPGSLSPPPGSLRSPTHLDSLNLSIQLPSLVRRHTSSDHSPTNPTSPTQSRLAGQEDVRDVLVLAEQGEVEQDLDGFGIGGHDDEFADTSVEGLESGNRERVVRGTELGCVCRPSEQWA